MGPINHVEGAIGGRFQKGVDSSAETDLLHQNADEVAYFPAHTCNLFGPLQIESYQG